MADDEKAKPTFYTQGMIRMVTNPSRVYVTITPSVDYSIKDPKDPKQETRRTVLFASSPATPDEVKTLAQGKEFDVEPAFLVQLSSAAAAKTMVRVTIRIEEPKYTVVGLIIPA